MASPLQPQQQHQQSQQQQQQQQPNKQQPSFFPSSPSSIVADRARAATHDALARCSYSGAAFFAEQLAALPGATPADAALLAHAHLLSGNPRRALAALHSSHGSIQASLIPDPRVRLLAARCLAALGRWDDVLDCLGACCEDDSNGGEEEESDDDDDADDDGNTGAGFLDLRPDENGVVPFDRAARAVEAESSRSSSSSSSPLLADAWLLRARARAAAGDSRGAAKAFERALRHDPRCVEAFDALVVGGLAPPARHAAIVEGAARRLRAEGDFWLVDLFSARCACAPGCGGGGGGGGGGRGGGVGDPPSPLQLAEAALARLQAPPPPPQTGTTALMNDDARAADAAANDTASFHSPDGFGGGSSSQQQPRRVTRAMARSGGGGGSASGGAGSVGGAGGGASGGGGGGATAFSTPGRGGGGPGSGPAPAAEAPPPTVSPGRRVGGGGAGAQATPARPPANPAGGRASSPSFGHGLSSSGDVAAAAASLALAQGNPRLACSLSSAALARDPGATLALRAHVAACAELGRRAELFSLAHGLVADRPRDPEAWHAVGSYYLCSNNPRSARRAFARALACCDGGHVGAWVGLGHACSLAGEGDAAVAAYRAAGGLAPGSPAPLLGQGVEAARMGAAALAASLLKAAHEAAPRDPAPCHELAVLALSSRSVVGGGSEEEDDDDEDDDEDDDVARRGGDPSAAEAWARRALSRFASASCSACEPTLVLLGHALLRQRKPEEACEAFERAIAASGVGSGGGGMNKNSTSSSTFVALGIARHASGDPSGAAEAYHSALAVAPGDSLAAELLDSALRDEAEQASEWLDRI